MKRNLWSCLPLLLGLALLLSGCVSPYYDRQPGMDEAVRWVCEDPEMWFSWDEEDPGFQGELVIGQDTLSIGVGFRGGVADVLCFESSDEALTGRTLFGGGFKLEEERFTIEVDRDNVGLFGEDLPTITFQKQERQGNNSSVSPDMT